jgi:hypothetical protein
MPALKPKIREGLAIADFGQELVVSDCQHGHSHLHYLNPSATLVFRICDGTGSVPELAADIADLYGLPPGAVEPDVREIIRGFRRMGLLTFKPVARRPAPNDEHHHGHEHDHAHSAVEPPDERARIQREVPPSD